MGLKTRFFSTIDLFRWRGGWKTHPLKRPDAPQTQATRRTVTLVALDFFLKKFDRRSAFWKLPGFLRELWDKLVLFLFEGVWGYWKVIFPGICGAIFVLGGILTSWPGEDFPKWFFLDGNDFSGILGIGPFNDVSTLKHGIFWCRVKNLGACSVVLSNEPRLRHWDHWDNLRIQ